LARSLGDGEEKKFNRIGFISNAKFKHLQNKNCLVIHSLRVHKQDQRTGAILGKSYEKTKLFVN